MPIAINSDNSGVVSGVGQVPLPAYIQPVEPPPQVPPAPSPPTVQPVTPVPAATASGAVDEEARGLPQAGYTPGDTGPIVAPYPGTLPSAQPTPEPPAPGAQPAQPEGTTGEGTAQFASDDPSFEGFTYQPYFGEGGGLVDESNLPKILRGWDFVRSVQQHSAAYGVDALAVVANAMAEGLNGGIGDSGHAFGPWQIWAEDGRLPQFSNQPLYSPLVQAWAWTDNGIEYAIRSMKAGGASGLTGHAAVEQIIYGFERPKDKVGAVRIRNANYDELRKWGSTVWDHVAALAQGPSLTPTTTGETSTGLAPVDTPKPKVSQAWRDLMKTLGSDMRFAAQHAETTANEIARMVRK